MRQMWSWCRHRFESLSLLALEAMAMGTPVLCNARAVLVGHCLRSNAGLFYADRDEFVEALSLLMADERCAARSWTQSSACRRITGWT